MGAFPGCLWWEVRTPVCGKDCIGVLERRFLQLLQTFASLKIGECLLDVLGVVVVCVEGFRYFG